MQTITYEQLYSMRRNQEHYVLIDVRPFEIYEEEHITDADNIPLDEVDFAGLVERRVVSRESKIVLYSNDENCPMAKRAAEKLEADGFTNVHVLQGGNKEWQRLHAEQEEKTAARAGAESHAAA